MEAIRIERQIAGRTLILETGNVARQSHGAVWMQYGDTVVLATVLTAPPTRDIDYFPLFVDYREYQYAAGKVPGGWFKREGRPSTKEVLTCRMIDRPIRPLFPDDFKNEVQIQCMVLSTDNQNDPDILAMIGASAALMISPAPFQGPIGMARVGYKDDKYLINPTHDELEGSIMNLVVCGHREAINMLELSGEQVPDDIVAEGIAKGFEAVQEAISMIQELIEKVGPVKKTYEPAPTPQELIGVVMDKYGEKIRQAKQIPAKVERTEAMTALREQLLAQMCPEDVEEPEYPPAQVKEAFHKTEGKIQREMILQGKRLDGRAPDEIRPLKIQVGVLPRTHGSAIFTRGETQALATTTLGTPRDMQIVDGLLEEYKKRFMLHYNFPPFCVGEIRPIRGPGRREIGHGALAEKSIETVLPDTDEFPYTIRIVADMLESNGSTSMASICGGTLSLMDAGVPIKAPVAGISIGMVSDDDKCVLLTDIVGEEDFFGDMDFKVAGTENGITGIQLDVKSGGITQDRIPQVLAQARQARLKIIEQMNKVIAKPRPELNPYAPRMLTIKIDPEKIGKVIGPGGKMINKIQDETKATIDIENDGTIFIASTEGTGAEAARDAIEALTEEPKLG
ncbi:MAG: polyribonucleotide nucleotidyltransferase, partial [Phycisphaerae bacterium]|nr:polyribonucleotide nucleotidyltransferase [Phycisphaerae bacterium]